MKFSEIETFAKSGALIATPSIPNARFAYTKRTTIEVVQLWSEANKRYLHSLGVKSIDVEGYYTVITEQGSIVILGSTIPLQDQFDWYVIGEI